MEMLDLHNGYGQNFGFILYRAYVPKGKKLTFTVPAQDRAQVIMNGKEIGVLYWKSTRWEIDIPENVLDSENILDILVEHHGRVNYVMMGFNRFNEESKGITGDVKLDGSVISNWRIYPMEFKEDYVNSMADNHKWKTFTNWDGGVASLYTANLRIDATPRDTFLNMKGWTKGNAFINGFNLGRYWKEGPQRTLYVPAPVLKTGNNKVSI
ncbi:beta-galactosidase-1-like protein 2 [Ruditapes philippinarum]|uniref:beta-galactosidase-1-like protein 2 n=1 Tax=Ruditapes philippinarum TaxID=129788 RepID=UPI00295B1BB8|nr:beta-galactosidase-1-like protein 2 [Ruditapes philippinarum]